MDESYFRMPGDAAAFLSIEHGIDLDPQRAVEVATLASKLGRAALRATNTQDAVQDPARFAAVQIALAKERARSP